MPLLPPAELQFIDADGHPYAAGTLATYVVGTTTPKTTWTDPGATIANTNPITLDARGACLCVGDGAYRTILKDAAGNTVFDQVTDSVVSLAMSPVTDAPTLADARDAMGITSAIATETAAREAADTAEAATRAAADLFILNRARVAKTSGYTVANGDKGATIALAGGAFYTLSFGATSGYDNGFICLIVNEDTYSSQGSGTQGRAKLISAAGGITFLLWPGQTVMAFSTGGNWKFLPAPNGTGGAGYRWKVPGAITLFVDPGLGSDANDGMTTGSGALATIAGAIIVLYQQIDCNNIQCTIQLADGTYTEAVRVDNPPVGSNVFFVTGNVATPANVVWAAPAIGDACLLVSDGAEMEISGITFSTAFTGCFAIFLHQTAIIDINAGIVFRAFNGGTHIGCDHGGASINMNAGYKVLGGAAVHISIGPNCIFNQTGGVVIDMTSAPIFTNIYAATGAGANINLSTSITYAGSATGTKYVLNGLCNFYAGSNTLPGSVAGTTVNGAVFVA